MALPAQVQAALDAADATLTAVNSAQTQDGGSADAATPPEAFQEVPTQEVVAPVAPPPATPDPFETKYKVLQGKYNSEVPELHRRVHGLETNLQQAIERLNDASKAKESAPEQRPTANPQDVENFGQDLVEMVTRVAGSSLGKLQQMLDSKFAAIETDIAKLKHSVSGTSQQIAVTAEQMFFTELGKAVPNYMDINDSVEFKQWLAEPDPVYGVPRQAALDRAQQQLNAQHVVAIFQAFAPPAPQAPAPDPVERQMSPRSTATPQVAPVNDKPVITTAQVTRFYDDVRRGMYRGKEAEAARIEQVINAALAEDRVR